MAVLQPSPISSKFFTHHQGILVCEASDLPRDFRLGRVFDDACDEGFTIISERTGAAKTFAHDGFVYDNEGELQYHTFMEINPRNGHTVHGGLRVNIYND